MNLQNSDASIASILFLCHRNSIQVSTCRNHLTSCDAPIYGGAAEVQKEKGNVHNLKSILLESDELFSLLSAPDYPARASIFLFSLHFSALSGNYTVTHRTTQYMLTLGGLELSGIYSHICFFHGNYDLRSCEPLGESAVYRWLFLSNI